MSAIEMKVAQLLMDSGNDAMPPSLQMEFDQEAPEIDFTKVPQLSE